MRIATSVRAVLSRIGHQDRPSKDDREQRRADRDFRRAVKRFRHGH